MTFPHSSASPLWFPDSVLLCALLLSQPRNWWVFLLGALPIRLLAAVPPDVPFWFLLSTFIIDSSKGLAVAAVLRRFLENPVRFHVVKEYLLFCVVAVVLAPAISGFAGAAARHALGYAFWQAWQQWFLGDAAAQLVVTPAILYGLFGDARIHWQTARRRWKESSLLVAGLILSAYLAFGRRSDGGLFSQSSSYAPVPFLFWAAIRFGMFGASSAIATISVVGIAVFLRKGGHLLGQQPGLDGPAALQDFLLSTAGPLYLIAVLIEQKNRIENSLRESEGRCREVIESQTELVCRYLPDTTLTFVNEAYCRFFDRTREQLIGRRFLELLPPGRRESAIEQLSDAVRQKKHWSWEHEVLRPGGATGWQHWINQPILGATGEIEEFQGIGHDITDRKRAAELARRLTQAQEEERKRIARDLHDDFNQRLAAHAIALSHFRTKVAEGPNDELQLLDHIGKLQEQAMALGEEIRLIAHELHPPSIEHDGLDGALRSFCREFGALNNINVRFEFEGSSRRIPPHITLCCFRVVQEGLRNVVKHARATEAHVKIVVAHDRLFLTLADNGVGLAAESDGSENGLGIDSMKERVELLSGEFHIANRQSSGAIITVTLPL